MMTMIMMMMMMSSHPDELFKLMLAKLSFATDRLQCLL